MSDDFAPLPPSSQCGETPDHRLRDAGCLPRLLIAPAEVTRRPGCRLVLVVVPQGGEAVLRTWPVRGLPDSECGYRLKAIERCTAAYVDLLLRKQEPSVLLVDVQFCAELGAAALRHLRHASPTTRWLLGWYKASPRWIDTVIYTQASGALAWSASRDELTRALDAVLAGEMWFSRRVMQWLYASMLNGASFQSTSSGFKLTEREADALALMRQGLTNQQIADELGISINTVKKQLGSAFEKLGLQARRRAVS